MNQHFEGIIGNDHIKEYLTRMVQKNAIGNTLLFSGVEGIGKSLFADSFAKLILEVDSLSNQPDLHIYRPEGKLGMHSIDSMRKLCEKVYLLPFSSKRKIFIIHHAEKMLPSSANALLKTFEEPSLDTVIILLTSNPAALIPTILSRCRVIRFHHIQENEIVKFLVSKYEKTEEEARLIAGLSAGSLGRAIRLVTNESDQIRKQILEILSSERFKFYRDIIDQSQKIYQLVEEVKKQEESHIRSSLTDELGSDLTASQAQNLTKEIDGAVAMRQSSFAETIFEQVLSWYRDLHLLKAGVDPSYLMNGDYIDKLNSFAKKDQILSIESVQEKISEAKLLLSRSTSLQIVLENLFLKLGMI